MAWFAMLLAKSGVKSPPEMQHYPWEKGEMDGKWISWFSHSQLCVIPTFGSFMFRSTAMTPSQALQALRGARPGDPDLCFRHELVQMVSICLFFSREVASN